MSKKNFSNFDKMLMHDHYHHFKLFENCHDVDECYHLLKNASPSFKRILEKVTGIHYNIILAAIQKLMSGGPQNRGADETQTGSGFFQDLGRIFHKISSPILSGLQAVTSFVPGLNMLSPAIGIVQSVNDKLQD